MHLYEGYKHEPFQYAGGRAHPTREDLERRYAETHRSAAAPKPKKPAGTWLERHAALLIVGLAVVVAVISLGAWVFTPIDMIVPLLAAILVYVGFLTGMVLL